MPRQTSLQITEATDEQIEYLKQRGFGTQTDIVRLAIDRIWREEMKTYFVSVGTNPVHGTWQERAKFDYKAAAAYAAACIKDNPKQRVTVWWQNLEAVIYNRADGVQYANSEVSIPPEFHYIAKTMLNAQEA